MKIKEETAWSIPCVTPLGQHKPKVITNKITQYFTCTAHTPYVTHICEHCVHIRKCLQFKHDLRNFQG